MKNLIRLLIFSALLCVTCHAISYAADFSQQVTLAKKILNSQKISTALGRDIIGIEASPENGIMLVTETVGSRNKFTIITPIIDVNEKSIFIDCSYIRKVDSSTGIVEVGSYCRGKSKATSDALVDATDDKYRLAYSAYAPWLQEVRKSVDCESPVGLVYAKIYFVRCQSDESDSLTQSVSTIVFSSEFEKLFSVKSAEFSPMKGISNPKKLIFWQYKNESTPIIIKKELNRAANRSPGFECDKATTILESIICSDEILSQLDSTMSTNYRQLKKTNIDENGARLSADQRAWLKQRNTCTTAECLIDVYTRRIDELCKKYPTQSGTCIRSKEP